MRNDRGSATVWVLAVIALLAFITVIAALRAVAVLARHEAETAADFAALAGASQLAAGTDPCAAARAVAIANGAQLERCEPDGMSVRVEVSRMLQLPIVGQHRATARARAARMPAP